MQAELLADQRHDAGVHLVLGCELGDAGEDELRHADLERRLRLRRITEPTTEQNYLLHQLGISLPERLNLHAKCSADSAIA